MSTKWRGYLLNNAWVDEMHDRDIGLNTLTHEEIVSHKELGPISINGLGHYKARKALFSALKKLGFPKDAKFMHFYRYLYIKNYDDDRGEGPNAYAIDAAFAAVQEYGRSE